MLDEKEAVDLVGGEDYLIYLEKNCYVKIWVNCDRNLQFRMTTDDFKKIIDSFIDKRVSLEFLKKLYQGYYLYTNKTNFRIVRPSSDFASIYKNPLPGLKDIMRHPENYQFDI